MATGRKNRGKAVAPTTDPGDAPQKVTTLLTRHTTEYMKRVASEVYLSKRVELSSAMLLRALVNGLADSGLNLTKEVDFTPAGDNARDDAVVIERRLRELFAARLKGKR